MCFEIIWYHVGGREERWDDISIYNRNIKDLEGFLRFNNAAICMVEVPDNCTLSKILSYPHFYNSFLSESILGKQKALMDTLIVSFNFLRIACENQIPRRDKLSSNYMALCSPFGITQAVCSRASLFRGVIRWRRSTFSHARIFMVLCYLPEVATRFRIRARCINRSLNRGAVRGEITSVSAREERRMRSRYTWDQNGEVWKGGGTRWDRESRCSSWHASPVHFRSSIIKLGGLSLGY